MSVVFLLTIGWMLVTLGGCKDGDDRVDESGASTRPAPVLLLGVDGLDLKIVKRLARKNRLPHLARLMESGASGIMVSEREMRSPAIWTTIATGRPRAVHGIYDFVTGSRLWPKAQRGGDERLVTSKMRRVEALWNMASEQERKVAVVGWLNTWPAEKVNGVMVSPYVAIGRAKQITIKGNVYPDEPYQVFPEERWAEIRALITVPDAVSDELVNHFVDEPEPDLVKAIPLLERYGDGLRWSLAHTTTMRDITLHLLEEEKPDLTMVYLEGADSLGHRFWLFRRSVAKIAAGLEDAGLPEEHAAALREAYGRVINSYYELVDDTLGKLMDAMPAGSRVMVVSDHGFGNRSKLYRLPKATPFTGEHRLEGMFIAAGEGIGQGVSVHGATIYDVAPTLHALLDLDDAPHFEGRSLLPQISQGAAADTSLPADEAEGAVAGETPDDEGFRAQEMERLRSLGYIQ